MFNLLIASQESSWDQGSYEIERTRFVTEYTVDVISERYKELTQERIDEIKSFPCLFVIENEKKESRIGFITDIRQRSKSIYFTFEFDHGFPPLPIGVIERIARDIDLGTYELSRTHWAIKNEPLFDILVRTGYLTQRQVQISLQRRSIPLPAPVERSPSTPIVFNTSQVFIVHGQDEIAKLEMAEFITSLGLEPIILHMQASSGLTIIEKIERYSNVGFAVVLYTPCDMGAKVGGIDFNYRARQNVVFEHGFLIGKLSRSRVVALSKGDIEFPNDFSGVLYIELREGHWQEQLKNEMRSQGYQV